MQLSDKSRTLPRLHLAGTLLLVTLQTLFLSGFFTWQKIHEHNASIQRIESSALQQLQQRLRREMLAIRADIDYTQTQTEVELRLRLTEMVDLAWTLATSLYQQQRYTLNEADLRRTIIEGLRPLRFFEGRGYYFIDEMNGRFILLPTAPEFEGQLLPDNQDDTGHYIMQGLIEAARLPVGEGFSAYRWYRPDDAERMADKLAYVRYFEPFDWLIGAGDYTYEWEKDLQQQLLTQIRNRRIGETGYTAVINTEGQVLLSLDSQHLEQQPIQSQSELEQAAIVQMLETAAEGGGFIRYLWPNPVTGEHSWKTALVEPAGHWNWILISTIFEDEVRGLLTNEVQAFEASASHNWHTYLTAIVISLLLALMASLLFSRWSSGLFRAYHAELSAQREALKRKADELALSESNIRHLAFHDALTGLANRRLLIDRLQQQLRQNQRNADFGALLFIDLDNFKTLNDTLGHDKGDELLRQVAHRISFCVREEDTVARFGGDEFVVMLGCLSRDEADAATRARVVAEKILTTLRQEYHFDGQHYFSTTSIGITLIHGNAIADELLKQADLAMYKAKDAGRNCLYFFDPAMQQALSARAQMESELRVALQQEQLLLYYQPQVDAAGVLTGAEALVRWQHPQRGLVAPAEFIPVAEASGLILPLGSWVLQQACKQLSVWAKTPGLSDLSISVNISAHQFKQPGFADEVLALVKHFQLVPQRLKLELTESLLIDDMAFSIERMRFLKQQGVGFALDDFGTGYSSLAYIKQLPLDQLKIDRCFIDGLPEDPNDAAITRIIISLANELNLWVVAEGVETEAQRDFLQAIQCSGYQGYWFGRPVPAAEFRQQALNRKQE
ncbi:MAG: EAL domain-containing protein [Nitrincola lacisaponensis]|uniref:EAL domain-containing protein n=1 Tax=Nitrincola lacisaponensis TaxID=267850 RepID=UPI00391A9037